ncbi:MAG: Uncharacterised protein [Flavobacterium sp. SCGC AAA160-P02]|nr:MAG: Uncharacterised protein [Flavobacterium sp. SCGC AAA160-P02]
MKAIFNRTRGGISPLVFLLLFSLNYTSVFSQKTNKVSYDIVEFNEKFEADLYFRSDFSVFIYKKSFEANYRFEDESNNIKILEKENLIYYYSLIDKEFLIKDFIFNKKFHIKDSIIIDNLTDSCKTTDWRITNVKKNILGYSCNQAKRFFRGREYTAYYTDKIPSSFGPWKLNDLPGLILEFSNGQNLFMQAKSIELNSSKYSKIKQDDILDELDSKESISQSEFNKIRIDRLEQRVKEMRTRLPSNIGLEIYSTNTDNVIEKFCE